MTLKMEPKSTKSRSWVDLDPFPQSTGGPPGPPLEACGSHLGHLGLNFGHFVHLVSCGPRFGPKSMHFGSNLEQFFEYFPIFQIPFPISNVPFPSKQTTMFENPKAIFGGGLTEVSICLKLYAACYSLPDSLHCSCVLQGLFPCMGQ